MLDGGGQQGGEEDARAPAVAASLRQEGLTGARQDPPPRDRGLRGGRYRVIERVGGAGERHSGSGAGQAGGRGQAQSRVGLWSEEQHPATRMGPARRSSAPGAWSICSG